MCFCTFRNSQLGMEIPNGHFIMCFCTFRNSQLGNEIPNGHFIMCFWPSRNSELGIEILSGHFIMCFWTSPAPLTKNKWLRMPRGPHEVRTRLDDFAKYQGSWFDRPPSKVHNNCVEGTIDLWVCLWSKWFTRGPFLKWCFGRKQIRYGTVQWSTSCVFLPKTYKCGWNSKLQNSFSPYLTKVRHVLNKHTFYGDESGVSGLRRPLYSGRRNWCRLKITFKMLTLLGRFTNTSKIKT